MNKNLDNFLSMFPDDNIPDIFVFSETWKDSNDPVSIPGYEGYHSVREGRSGGVSVFVKGQIPSCKLENLSYVNNTIEMVRIYKNIHLKCFE